MGILGAEGNGLGLCFTDGSIRFCRTPEAEVVDRVHNRSLTEGILSSGCTVAESVATLRSTTAGLCQGTWKNECTGYISDKAEKQKCASELTVVGLRIESELVLCR